MKLHYNFLYYAYHTNDTVDTIDPQVSFWHDITICLRGRMRYEINGRQTVVNKGDIIYLAPGESIKRFAGSNQDNTFISLNLVGDKERLLENTLYPASVNKKCLDLLKEIDQAFIFGEKDTICLLCLILVQELKKQQISAKEDPRISRMKNYIYNHIYEKISVDMIARDIGYSDIYCNALFKKHTGQTLKDFVNETKISLAQNHLKNSSISLSNLATKLNFSTYNYFSRCFKKHTGITPKQYIMLSKNDAPHNTASNDT